MAGLHITGPEVAPQTAEQIKLEINEVLHKIIKSITDLDVRSMFEAFDNSSAIFINNEVIHDNLNSAYRRFSKYYEQLESLQLILNEWETKVLTESLAINYVNGIAQSTYKTGHIINNNISWTAIFRKKESDWKMIHLHQSFMPMQ